MYVFPCFNMVFKNRRADYCSLSPSLEISLLLAYLYRKIISLAPMDGSQLSISMRFPVVKERRIWLFFSSPTRIPFFPKRICPVHEKNKNECRRIYTMEFKYLLVVI